MTATPWNDDVPNELNGYPVVGYREHPNGYVTVMLERPHAYEPYIVATWWPELGTRWQWGHYTAALPDAKKAFRDAAERNQRRGRLK